MVFEIISLTTAFVGSALAGIWDLKTTEIPDKIPHIMIAVGLAIAGINSYLSWSYQPLLYSAIAGLSLLGFGFLMYYLGQWGGGDAKILAAVGFLLPILPGVKLMFPFPLSYLFNVFIIGAVYMTIYAIVLAVLNKKIISQFSKDIKASSNILLFGSVALFFTFFAINWFLSNYFQIAFDFQFILVNSLLPLILLISLFFVWKFGKAVENIGFRKKIPVSKLKIGDVLEKSKVWEGITEKELRKIKKTKSRFIWIKEGVRFAPVFPLTLLFTLYFGDGILFFINFLV